MALGLAAVLCIAAAVTSVILLFGNKAPTKADSSTFNIFLYVTYYGYGSVTLTTQGYTVGSASTTLSSYGASYNRTVTGYFGDTVTSGQGNGSISMTGGFIVAVPSDVDIDYVKYGYGSASTTLYHSAMTTASNLNLNGSYYCSYNNGTSNGDLSETSGIHKNGSSVGYSFFSHQSFSVYLEIYSKVPTTNTVTYNYNGATGNNTTTSATVTYGSSYTLVVPTRTGYSFNGWWSATSGGTQYTNASGASLSNWSGISNITVYAQWTANSATFTYNANSGTMTGNTSDARSTATTTALKTTVTRTGYTFKGWYTAASGGTQITNASGAPLVASGYCTTAGTWLITGSSITVYAQWTANTYTLTYSYNNATGNNTTASATVTYNASYNLVVPTRTGYTFTGWWSATSGGTQYTNASGASLANWAGTAGITIYAQWTANTYTLTYNYNNATGNNTITSATVTYNASYNLVVPTRTGYAFTGWWSATSGGTQYTNNAGASLANWTGTAGITIYAQWTANTYTLTYNYNNATGNNTTTSATVTYNSSYTLIVPTRTGYSFMGWWSATSGGTQYTNSSGVSLVNWTGNASVNIYAQWTGYNYTVRFNANNGTGSTSIQSFVYGVAQTLTANPYTKENFKFMGWATSQASADNGTVTYTNSHSVNELTTTSNGTVDLYAVWSTNFATYYLCYAGGISADGNSGYVTPGVAIALPGTAEMAAYAPTGMTFAGWYENADLSGTTVTQVLISTAGAVKYYYAKWV